MRKIFDDLSFTISKKVTTTYSTSFSMAVNMLDKSIRSAIYSIYGFVRFADEIVDSFHETDKQKLLYKFEEDFYKSLKDGISLNPIINSFQKTVREFNIDLDLVDAFIKSMKMDLKKEDYSSQEDFNNYIYGSADVVGLMCLKVFVNGSDEDYNKLKSSAMKLGSAFQKVNFLRDLKDDIEILNRSYFPNVNFNELDKETKKEIINEIEDDFREAYKGIVQLPNSSKFGVYTAYVYYKQLLNKLKKTPSSEILERRIRVSNPNKIGLLMMSYFNLKFNLIK